MHLGVGNVVTYWQEPPGKVTGKRKMILKQVKRHPLGTLFDKKIREILGIDRNDGRTPTPKLFWTHFPPKNVFDMIMNLWEAIINCIITKKYSSVAIQNVNIDCSKSSDKSSLPTPKVRWHTPGCKCKRSWKLIVATITVTSFPPPHPTFPSTF